MAEKKLVIDGNAVYEIDEACMERRRKQREALEQVIGKTAQGAEKRKRHP